MDPGPMQWYIYIAVAARVVKIAYYIDYLYCLYIWDELGWTKFGAQFASLGSYGAGGNDYFALNFWTSPKVSPFITLLAAVPKAQMWSSKKCP